MARRRVVLDELAVHVLDDVVLALLVTKVQETLVGQIVTLRADVFNLLNSQAVQKRNEIGDLDFSGTDPSDFTTIPNPTYGLPTLYQAPRSVRLGMDIEF